MSVSMHHRNSETRALNRGGWRTRRRPRRCCGPGARRPPTVRFASARPMLRGAPSRTGPVPVLHAFVVAHHEKRRELRVDLEEVAALDSLGDQRADQPFQPAPALPVVVEAIALARCQTVGLADVERQLAERLHVAENESVQTCSSRAVGDGERFSEFERRGIWRGRQAPQRSRRGSGSSSRGMTGRAPQPLAMLAIVVPPIPCSPNSRPCLDEDVVGRIAVHWTTVAPRGGRCDALLVRPARSVGGLTRRTVPLGAPPGFELTSARAPGDLGAAGGAGEACGAPIRE